MNPLLRRCWSTVFLNNRFSSPLKPSTFAPAFLFLGTSDLGLRALLRNRVRQLHDRLLLRVHCGRYLLKSNTVGSTIGMPTRVNRSHSIELLMRASSVESMPNEGDKLTSSSHGFNLSSTRMSNPYSSEQHTKRILIGRNCVLDVKE